MFLGFVGNALGSFRFVLRFRPLQAFLRFIFWCRVLELVQLRALRICDLGFRVPLGVSEAFGPTCLGPLI